MRPLVRLDRVGKRFPNGTVALHDFSLEVGEHDFISLLGPSGCGKTTVLRLLAGLSPATSGKLTWAAHRSLGASRTDRELAFVFQEPTLMPWATVFDNVYLPLRLSGVTREQAGDTVRDALAMVGLGRFATAWPHELSGGMKMRASIARALVTHPRLLLMDEPFAALDEMTRGKLENDLLAIWKEHRFTVIFVTHSVWESVYLSNRIVVMAARPGRVVQELRIGEPYPRHAGDFHVSSRYNEHVKAVQRVLHATMAGADVDH
ncbi:MAG: ABC transporter ATP-binding protein [Rubrivivax sp.]